MVLRHDFETIALSSGRFFKDLLRSVAAETRGQTIPRRISLYACHDVTLIPILIALDVFDSVYVWYGMVWYGMVWYGRSIIIY